MTAATELTTRRDGRHESHPHLLRKLCDLIAPRDHAGKGNWSKDADIPRVWAWSAGVAFAAFCLFGRQVLSWLLSFAT